MMLLRNPIIWLRRIAKRKGYGIHSPFAFDFVTDVLYNKEQYYAYRSIDSSLRWWQRGRVRDLHHLMLRLANYHAPQTLYCHGLEASLVRACQLGKQGVTLVSSADSRPADMIVIDHADERVFSLVGDNTMLVLCDLTHNLAFWKQIRDNDRVRVTFDLYDLGIAFSRPTLNEQHYIINW